MRVIIHGITVKMGQMIKSLADANYAGSVFAAGVSPDVTVEGNGLYKNVPGNYFMHMFESGIRYFK